jgi:antitoxin (DNA-binding transcriptional repressor) of toxin-antitoxin stability system
MQATLTEVHRQAKRVFRHVQSGQSAHVTEHGKPLAKIVPDYERRVITLEEFYQTDLTDEAILEAIRESRE